MHEEGVKECSPNQLSRDSFTCGGNRLTTIPKYHSFFNEWIYSRSSPDACLQAIAQRLEPSNSAISNDDVVDVERRQSSK